MTIQLGQQVKDKITGFKGIATSRVEYITGCTQYGVVPKVDKEGKLPETYYFDEDRLEEIGKAISLNKNIAGGPSIKVPARRP